MPPSSYVRHSDRSNCVAPPSRATMRIGSRDLAGGWAVHEDGTSRASARSENDGRSSPLLSCGDWLQRSSAATAFGSGGASDVAEASCAPARADCIAPATRTHKSDGHVEGGRLWPSYLGGEHVFHATGAPRAMPTPPGLDPVTNMAQPMFAALRAQLAPSTRPVPRALTNKTVDAGSVSPSELVPSSASPRGLIGRSCTVHVLCLSACV